MSGSNATNSKINQAHELGQMACRNIVLSLTEHEGAPRFQVTSLEAAAKSMEKAAQILRETASSPMITEAEQEEKLQAAQTEVVISLLNEAEGWAEQAAEAVRQCGTTKSAEKFVNNVQACLRTLKEPAASTSS
ncbi:hypothetical protein ACQU0X_25865 [Pseudovibrio ascidiaceicola]|uniref:hypothetical protein n=1 Tax=Pseudovibrio ascidiaceicola TaxID=285279 RepID=UPI003D36319F